MKVRTLLIALLLTASQIVPAQSVGMVEGLQMPAWIERGGDRMPLRAGMALETNDRVITGRDSRVLLRLAEGSHVKLGQNADFHLRELFPPPPGGGGAFRGFFDVLKGAFRFTTTLISKRHQRDLSVRISGLTTGVRGTDLWGKAANDRDIVCLIEGEISVQRGQDQPFVMSDPLSFYIAPKNAPPLPVAPVDAERLAQWAEETELQSGGGILRDAGKWSVNLKSLRRESLARATVADLAAAGYATKVSEATVDGTTWYRVRVVGFESVAEARGFTRRIEGEHDIAGAWVARS